MIQVEYDHAEARGGIVERWDVLKAILLIPNPAVVRGALARPCRVGPIDDMWPPQAAEPHGAAHE